MNLLRLTPQDFWAKLFSINKNFIFWLMDNNNPSAGSGDMDSMGSNMSSNGPISITQALNQIQSWLNAGEYSKVIQGCQEILEMEPGNQRAFALMKKAEQQRHAETQSTPQPDSNPPSMEPENTQPQPDANQAPTAENRMNEDRVEPMEDPLAHLQVENHASDNSQPESSAEPFTAPDLSPAATPAATPSAATNPFTEEDELQAEEKEIFRASEPAYAMPEKSKELLTMLIPALLVVIIGGGILWTLADRQHEDEIASIETKDLSYLEANEERVQVLTTLEGVLDKYEDQHGEYPSASKIESVIEDSEYFSSIPEDARHGEFDKAGKVFGYMYAVYDTAAGDNTAYIVSALFEDSRGFGYAWTRGASTQLYDGYRDSNSDDVVFIGSDDVSSDPTDSSSTISVDSSDSDSDSNDSSGPKVKVE